MFSSFTWITSSWYYFEKNIKLSNLFECNLYDFYFNILQNRSHAVILIFLWQFFKVYTDVALKLQKLREYKFDDVAITMI